MSTEHVPTELIRLTPEQMACPHDKVEYLGRDAMFRCIGREAHGRDGDTKLQPGCGAVMVIPEIEERYRRKCDE